MGGGVFFLKKSWLKRRESFVQIQYFYFTYWGVRTHPLPTGLSLHFTFTVSRHAPLSVAPFCGVIWSPI